MPQTLLIGDCRDLLPTLPAESVQCCVTSPPYWGLRDYGCKGQIGQEPTPEAFVQTLVSVFREVRRVLKTDGTCWINLGDSYSANCSGNNGYKDGRSNRAERKGPGIPAGLRPKNLVGMPWRVAFALQADGWYLRQDIIWAKPNPMPESVTDRCTKAHEYLFLLSKSERYFYDAQAIKEKASDGTHPRKPGNGYKTPDGWDTSKGQGGHGAFHRAGREKGRKHDPAAGNKNNPSFDAALAIMPEFRNKRSVWTVPTAPYKEAHFATYPPDLIKPCILAGSRPGDVILDPFGGSGTTGAVALELGRSSLLLELNPDYAALAEHRTNITPGLPL